MDKKIKKIIFLTIILFIIFILFMNIKQVYEKYYYIKKSNEIISNTKIKDDHNLSFDLKKTKNEKITLKYSEIIKKRGSLEGNPSCSMYECYDLGDGWYILHKRFSD